MEPLRYLIVACSIGIVFLMLLKMFDMIFPQGKHFHRKKYVWTLIVIYAIDSMVVKIKINSIIARNIAPALPIDTDIASCMKAIPY